MAQPSLAADRTRAYALLTVKAVDDEQRVIEGIASTPEADRVGDIIESAGIQFRNPAPLLLYHDKRQPVGTVRFTREAAALSFTAKMAQIEEPGPLRDRVQEAWLSVKAGLLKGVSIGFRVLDDAVDFMQDTGGLRFRKIEVLELSLVTVPAHQAATIHTIKQFDTSRPAAPGSPPSRVSGHRPGAPGTQITAMKNLSEQITQQRAELKTKTARLEELITKAGSETLSDDDTAERERLRGEVKALVASIEELETLEAAQISQARPVVAKTQADGSTSRDPVPFKSVTTKDTRPPGLAFAQLASCLMAARGMAFVAAQIAKERYPDDPRIQTLLKVSVSGATTTHPTWAGPLVDAQTLVSEFIEFLRPQTIIGRIPNLTMVPFNVRITGQTSGGTGYWVGQAAPKPLTSYNFNAITLTWAKVAAISVLSQELARFSSPSAELLIRNALAASLIERLDIDFIDPDKPLVANVSPASITNGIGSIVPSGTNADAVRTDIAAVLNVLIAGNINPTGGVWIMPNTVALNLQLMRNALGNREFPDITMNGGTLEGFPVVTSQYAGFTSPEDNVVIFVNAPDIFMSDDGTVAIDASGEASLQMQDNPTNTAGSPSTESTMVSMFQTNSIALRAERFINWQRRRTAAVAWLHGVQWAAGSPS